MTELRNLRLMLVDDEPSFQSFRRVLPEVDLVLPFDPQLSPNHFFRNHCVAVARQHRIEYDLLLIDINFKRDVTDPANIYTTQPPISAGLLHGYAVIERRKTNDAGNNRLPFSVLLRTKNPNDYSVFFDPSSSQAIVFAETLRRFGLLRARMARPLPEESLESCIKREFEEDFLGDRFPIEVNESTKFVHVLKADLEGRQPHAGEPLRVASHLLHHWRILFLKAVREEDVSLDVEPLYRIISDFEKAGSEMDLDYLRKHGVPVSGRMRSGRRYDIALSSIFQDHLCNDKLNVKSPLRWWDPAGQVHEDKGSALEWLDALLDSAGQQTNLANPEVAALRSRVELLQGILKNRAAEGYLSSLWRAFRGNEHWRERVIIYSAMILLDYAAAVRGKNISSLDVAYESPAEQIGIEVRTLRRTFEQRGAKTELLAFNAASLKAFFSSFLASLAGEPHAKPSVLNLEWLAAPLRDFVLLPDHHNGLGFSGDEAARHFPGLFE